MDEKFEILQLIKQLNNATKAYDEGHPIMSDKEWDDLYFQLEQLEKQTGIIYSDSPTQNIIFKQVSELKKIEHNHPMLSLDKTKDISVINNFINGKPWVGMFKLDGISCSLTYINGILHHADTRGNGYIGEDITNNIYTLKSVPLEIPTQKEKIVIDGEILCTIDNFEKFQNEYKNPRNFAAGSIRLLNAKECANRNLLFVAWDFIQGYKNNSFMNKLKELDDFGFITVPRINDVKTVNEAIEILNEWKELTTFPIDGYVFRFDDQEYYDSLGSTAHHFNGAKAYKFYDETYSTTLKYIDWTMGRTGVLTPVAVFEPIDIEGSIVERASLHNLSVMEDILGIPFEKQKLQVFKANMIIPQIYSAEKPKEKPNSPIIPLIEKCPICGEDVEIINNDGVKIIVCTNPSCQGKLINRLEHFFGKKGLDIKGISKATFQKLIDWEWVNQIIDVFHLSTHRNEWITKLGFGLASVDKILKAIENGKRTQLSAFISAIGIPLIGQAAAKDLTNYFKTYSDFRNAVIDKNYHFFAIDNFGEEMDNSIKNFDYTEADKLSEILIFEAPVVNKEIINNSLIGKTIVITGKLTNYKNRDELKAIIQQHGGKVSDSISNKTNILINNDINSTSSKNKAAKERNIPILSELDFVKQYIEN